MANEPIRAVVVNGNTYELLADSAEVRDLLTAEDNTVFQFVKEGNKYGCRDANGNFIPFDKVQAGKTATAGTSVKTVTPDGDYDGLASVTINPTPSQAKSITAATSAQTVSPDSGKLLSKVTVNPQPHTETRATVTSNGTIDLGTNHATRYVPVAVSGVVGDGTIVHRSVHDDHRSGEAVTYTYTATSAGTYLAIGLEYGGGNPSTTGTITFSTTGIKVSSGDDYYNANGRAVRIAWGVFILASNKSVSATCTAPVGEWPCRCLKVFKV